MEFTLPIIFVITAGALICEFIDSSLGMLYGTLLSPALIIAGLDPLLVVPSILFSQTLGGFTAAVFHHRLKSADFSLKSVNSRSGAPSRDLKIVICITSLGIAASVFAAFLAVNIRAIVLKTYMGAIILVMGIVLILKVNFKFSWKTMLGIGVLSAFNKSMSGGGFGPVVTAGQVIGGRNSKEAVGVTTLAEAPICAAGFLTFLLTNGIPGWRLTAMLSIGAVMGAVIGPSFTAKFRSEKKLKLTLGILVLILGIFVLLNTWFLKIKGIGV